MTETVAAENGLPANPEAERFLLGSILLDRQHGHFLTVSQTLTPDDFVLEKHRRIFRRMGDIDARGQVIDHLALAEELNRHSELASVDGLAYITSLDDGLPLIPNVSGYIRIVQEKSQLRRIAFTAQHAMNQALLGMETPQDIAASAGESLIGIGVSKSDSGPRTPRQIIQEFPGGINAFLKPGNRAKGLATGFTRFDDMTGGLHGGELVILAARPSMGKTAMALNIAWNAALRGHAVVIFSMEMSAESLLTRMLCSAARVDSQRFRSGFLNENERSRLRDSVNEALALLITIDDTPGLTLMDVRAGLVPILRSGQPLGLVVIDYLQLMSSKGRSENRTQEVSQLSRGFKLLSKELNCPFLVLSQLSRATETRTGDHRPQLSDLRESGSIEQDADVVGFIFREEVYKRDREDLHGLAELIIAKQRSGPIGKIDLIFLHALTRFENRAEDQPDVPEASSRLPYAE